MTTEPRSGNPTLGEWGADAAAEAATRTVTAAVVNSAIAAITVLPRS
ncbi:MULTISPECIES: hypothetical protein [Micromonospora]|nr:MULTISPECIES: hypothetical protein [Micromonospora]MCG5449779.1 hypothetical protein [Micromonospora hortensis]MCX5121924.1 hypothetical protein [Micromonospora sp. NBC_00362]WTI06241.1 hypothetical protein OHB44_22745 [Micromonospora sp. NBC_00821]